MQFPFRGWFVLTLFFCSGTTALIYEVIWSKFLSQMLGSTIYAQTVVLAVFMGGLGLGNWWFGRRADGLANPLRAYGVLELAIGSYAFLFPFIDRAVDWAFTRAGSVLIQHSTILLVLKALSSAAVLLLPTILMGGTLPILAAWLETFSKDAGRRSVWFYSVNTLGAVLGCWLAGFWLVQHFGLIGAVWLAAVSNVIIGTVAVALGQRGVVAPVKLLKQLVSSFGRSDTPLKQGVNESGDNAADGILARAETAGSKKPGALSLKALDFAGVIVAATGGVCMGLEVLASRAMILIFGPSLQSFALVLIAFIAGIFLGSAAAASFRWRKATKEKAVMMVLTIAAAWVTFLVFNIEQWVDLYRMAVCKLPRTDTGYVYYECLAAGMSLVVLGLPAACIGSVLPLMIRGDDGHEKQIGAKVGSLLTWNTLGAVGGTLITGFLLMPRMGLRDAFGILATLLAAIGLFMAFKQRWTEAIVGTALVTVFCGSIFVFGEEDWRYVINLGAFRLREAQFNPGLMLLHKQFTKILFYEDAPDATVTVEQALDVPNAELSLRINGKVDASSSGDISTQLLLAHIPMLSKPDATNVFVLGFGTGITAGAVLNYPGATLAVAENCAPVVRAAPLFAQWNHDVLANPRTHLWREDARTVLKLCPDLYDIVITEPSNPWAVGVGSVFSREFYQIAAKRLKPGGLVAQWFHVYELDNEIVSLVLRTFSSVFPYVEVWDTSRGDILLLGSLKPWLSGPEVFRNRFQLEGVRADLARLNIRSPEALLARQLASQRTGFAIAADGRIQSDIWPILEYDAPRKFYVGGLSTVLDSFDERTRQQLLAPASKRATLQGLGLDGAQTVFSTFGPVNGELFQFLLGNSQTNLPSVFTTNTPLEHVGAEIGGLSKMQQAVAALNGGEAENAGRLIGLLVQNEPANMEAKFLRRIVEREQLSQIPKGAK